MSSFSMRTLAKIPCLESLELFYSFECEEMMEVLAKHCVGLRSFSIQTGKLLTDKGGWMKKLFRLEKLSLRSCPGLVESLAEEETLPRLGNFTKLAIDHFTGGTITVAMKELAKCKGLTSLQSPVSVITLDDIKTLRSTSSPIHSMAFQLDVRQDLQEFLEELKGLPKLKCCSIYDAMSRNEISGLPYKPYMFTKVEDNLYGMIATMASNEIDKGVVRAMLSWTGGDKKKDKFAYMR